VTDVLVGDDRVDFGVLAALGIEGLPAHRIARVEECRGRVPRRAHEILVQEAS
jgi:hypothetical protein